MWGTLFRPKLDNRVTINYSSRVNWKHFCSSSPEPFCGSISNEGPYKYSILLLLLPRSTSVAPHRIVNPLPLVCWSAYRKSNRGWAETECLENRIYLDNSTTLDNNSPRSRKKPLWSVGNQSHRWWRYGISVSSSTGSWQWRLTWAILYVAACINYAASSGRWPSTAGVHLPQHLLLVASATATVSYMVSRKEKFSDFKWFWILLRDLLLVRESLATSPQSSVMSSTGSLYSIESAKKSPYWLGTVFTALARPISATFALRWLTRLDEPTSATCGDLMIPRTRMKLGERSFWISALTVWNSLPYSLKHSATSCKHFWKELKTYMFGKVYAPRSTSLWELLNAELTYYVQNLLQEIYSVIIMILNLIQEQYF